MAICGFPWWLSGKAYAAMQDMKEILVRSLGQEDPLEKGMATHSSIHAWKTLWMGSLVGSNAWGPKKQAQLSD